MAAVYVRQNTAHLGSFATDTAVMSALAGGVAVPLGIVQNLQIQFGQQVARIYDLTNGGAAAVDKIAAVYYVGGRTNGQLTLARVVGPAAGNVGDFYTKTSDICAPVTLSFGFDSTLCVPAGGKQVKAPKTEYVVTGALLTNVGITVAAQDMIINESCTLMFANLTVTP